MVDVQSLSRGGNPAHRNSRRQFPNPGEVHDVLLSTPEMARAVACVVGAGKWEKVMGRGQFSLLTLAAVGKGKG